MLSRDTGEELMIWFLMMLLPHKCPHIFVVGEERDPVKVALVRSNVI